MKVRSRRTILAAKKRATLRAKAEALPPEERWSLIPANCQPSEFEIQAFLYFSLQSIGYTVRGEIMSNCRTCIFDLVVYVGDIPIRIIEVKKSKREGHDKKARRKEKIKRAKQIEKYSWFGVPVDAVCNMTEAKCYTDRARLNGI